MEEKGKQQRFLAGISRITIVIITIVVVVLLNLFLSQKTITYDLTDNKMYTLSPASVAAVESLKEAVEIKAFISPNMPVPLHIVRQNVEDLLSDYVASSNGKLSYQIISPEGKDEAVEKEAKKYGIEKVAIGQRSENEVSLRAVYKGIAFVMGDKQEVIGDLRMTGNNAFDNFEYEFTKALLNLQNENSKKVAFLSGYGGAVADQNFVPIIEPMFKDIYGNLFEVSAIDLSADDAKLDQEIDALVILNIEKSVGPKALFLIDQYIQGGGSVAWFQSATIQDNEMAMKIRAQMGNKGPLPDVRKKLDTGLNDFFAEMGLKLNSDVVLDRERALATGYIMTDKGPAQVSHPASFLLEDLDRTLPFIASIPTLVLPAPSSITISERIRKRKGVKISEIAKSEKSSIRRSEPPQTLNYQNFLDIGVSEQPGPFVVAAALRGNIPSYYRDNALPEGVDENKLVKNTKKGRLLIVGSGDFFLANNQVGFDAQLAGVGGQFLFSTIEWLAQNTALSEIRGKKSPKIIGAVPKEDQRKIQFANIVAVPSLFAFFGVMIMSFRRRRKEKFEL